MERSLIMSSEPRVNGKRYYLVLHVYGVEVGLNCSDLNHGQFFPTFTTDINFFEASYPLNYTILLTTRISHLSRMPPNVLRAPIHFTQAGVTNFPSRFSILNNLPLIQI